MSAPRFRVRLQVLRGDVARVDRVLLTATGALLTIGFIAVFSSTITHDGGQGAYVFLAKQMVHAAIGVAAGVAVWMFLPMRQLRDRSALVAGVAVASLLFVHLPFLGVATDLGAARWIDLGVMTVQPVEIAKIAVIVYVCAYCAANRENLGTLGGFLRPLGMVLAADLFLMTQPDFGSVVLLTFLALAAMFIAGAGLVYFAVAAGSLAALAGLAAVAAPYRMQRLLAFSDPFADPLGSGYHQTHSLMAIGRGGWTGSGLGQSVEKWAHLPEAHTDFIVSVIAEETGMIGFIVVLALYGLIMHRAFDIAGHAERCGKMFEALLARSIGLLLVVQCFINVGGNLSLLPVKGLTLPLISYGGSSLVAWLVTIALLQVIAADTEMLEERILDRERGTAAA